MEYVIDFQGFHDDADNFILKEVCIQSVENGKLLGERKQFLLLPPFDFKYLSDSKKKEVNYLKNCYHKFTWNCGLQEYDEIYSIFKNLTDIRCIYVKGSEKKKVLEKEFNSHIKIIDLETLNCPSLSVLKQRYRLCDNCVNCPFMHNTQNCSVYHVYLLTKWILHYWNSACKEHSENFIKRIECWDCAL